MTRKWYATLRHPKMYPHTKFGIPTSKNIGDMDRTRKWDGRTDGRTDGLTDGRTVRLLYASQSSFGGIKRLCQLFGPQTYLQWDQLSISKKTVRLYTKGGPTFSRGGSRTQLLIPYRTCDFQGESRPPVPPPQPPLWVRA